MSGCERGGEREREREREREGGDGGEQYLYMMCNKKYMLLRMDGYMTTFRASCSSRFQWF
jgi:hypothetical protein